MVKNFRYEEEGAIALSGVPDSPEAVDWLHDQGIRAVLSLHPVSPDAQARMKERGIEWRSFPITDFAQGVPHGLSEALEFVDHHARQAPAALIH